MVGVYGGMGVGGDGWKGGRVEGWKGREGNGNGKVKVGVEWQRRDICIFRSRAPRIGKKNRGPLESSILYRYS